MVVFSAEFTRTTRPRVFRDTWMMYGEPELIERLRLICGERHVLTSPAALAAYADGTRPLPSMVVLPGAVTEVVAAITACAAAGVSYAPRGANGYGPSDVQVLVALTRLRQIVKLDRAAGRIAVEAGAPIAAVRRALPRQLSIFPELSAPGVGTVGGALACGFGRGSLAALELVSSVGTLVHLDRAADGYDVAGGFVGSYGRRGIAVRAQLRLSPVRPAEHAEHDENRTVGPDASAAAGGAGDD